MRLPTRQIDESLPAATIPTEEVAGGFAADTEVMTTRGPVPVTNLTSGDAVYALEPMTRLVKLKPLLGIGAGETEELIEIRTRRADLGVAPDHPLVYRTKTIDRPRFVRAGNVEEREYYQFVNQWRRPPREGRQTIDVTEFIHEYQACVATTDHGHTFRAALPEGCDPTYRSKNVGYCFDAETFERFQARLEELGESVGIRAKRGHRPQPYEFDADAFIQFLGWFVSEGSVHYSSNCESAEIQIAQEKPEHRSTIRTLFDKLGFEISIDDRSFYFGSYLYGRLLETLCGLRSADRRLPEFVWDLNWNQQELLLEVLLDGDGNECGTYYTSSEQLAGDILCLCLELGLKPRYSLRQGMWQIFVNAVNDGFTSTEHVRRESEKRRVYRLTVADYSAVMAGRDGRFQWVGVNRVS